MPRGEYEFFSVRRSEWEDVRDISWLGRITVGIRKGECVGGPRVVGGGIRGGAAIPRGVVSRSSIGVDSSTEGLIRATHSGISSFRTVRFSSVGKRVGRVPTRCGYRGLFGLSLGTASVSKRRDTFRNYSRGRSRIFRG